MSLLTEKGLDDVLVLMGGIIPDADIDRLKALGVRGVFQPGTPMQDIIDFIQAQARARV
jgi:methylmalonyl-CoA mutase, C-terminal domain